MKEYKMKIINLKKVLALVGCNSINAVGVTPSDMKDSTESITNVFGAVLGVAVLIYGFKKVKALLHDPYLEKLRLRKRMKFIRISKSKHNKKLQYLPYKKLNHYYKQRILRIKN